MKDTIDPKLIDGRIRKGEFASDGSYGLTGAFVVFGPRGEWLRIIADNTDAAWEHVSVSTTHRTPNWTEMCFVKNLFWNEDECVIQYHPPKKDYVNCHPYCLHLWKPLKHVIPMPPPIMVGPKVA